VWVGRAFGQDALNNPLGQLAAGLVLLFDNHHAAAGLNLTPFGWNHAHSLLYPKYNPTDGYPFPPHPLRDIRDLVGY
jgi:hypothetical protein